MEGEDDYSMLSEKETRELRLTVLLEYNVRREIEENVLEDEPDSSEEDSDGEDEDDELPFEFSEAEITQRSKVEAFVRETCGCKLTEQEKPCSSAIPKEEFIDCRNNCMELSSTELDVVLLGAIHSSINCSDISTSGGIETTRKRTGTPFFYHGKRICRKTFLFLHCIHQKRFYSLLKHKKNGLSVRLHGNNKRLPSSTCSAETIENVVKFIGNEAEDQALLLSGRVPGFKRIAIYPHKVQSLENLP